MQKNINVVQELLKKTNEAKKSLPPLRILITGKTGVGKSTLINAVFGEELATTGVGKPVTSHLRRYSTKNNLVLFDTKGLELVGSTLEETDKEISDFLREAQIQGEPIHMIWYCINSMGHRVEETELKLMTSLSKQVPLLCLLTQSIAGKGGELKRVIEAYNLPIAGVLEVLAEDYTLGKTTFPAWGLAELIAFCYSLLPKGVDLTFLQAQTDIDLKVKEARRYVKGYVATTFGVGFTPIPFADATLLVPTQLGMLAHLTMLFGVDMDENMLLALLTALGGTTGATHLGRGIVSQVLKMVPGAGTLMGGLISGTTAALVTTSLGYSYIAVLANYTKAQREGQKLEPKALVDMLKSQLKKNTKALSKDKSFDDGPDKPPLLKRLGHVIKRK